MTTINARGLSEADGDQLRDLLAAFTWRTSVLKEEYALAREDGAVLSVLAVRRARWRAWSAATLQFHRAFDWTSVPSVVPAEARELLAAERRRKAAELAELAAQIRERTRGTPEGSVDEELQRLRDGEDE